MTNTARAITHPDGTREYAWPNAANPEFVARSVTTIKDGGVPMPFLQQWFANMAASYATESPDKWMFLDREHAYDNIRFAATRYRDERGVTGDEVHDAIERWQAMGLVAGEPVPVEFARDLSNDARGCFAAYLAFEKKWKPRWLHSEVTIFSREHNYAGTTDNIGVIDFPDRGERNTIVDYKTSNRVYDDVCIQMVGYARGDFIAGINERGEDIEISLPSPLDDALTVRLGRDGKYTAIPWTITDELFELFLHVQAVSQREEVFKAHRRKALNSRPRKDK